MTQRWLKCKVSAGMFSDERVVELRVKLGHARTFFVPADRVLDQGAGEGQIQVGVVTQGEVTLVILPTPSRDVVPCAEDDLVPV